MADSEAKRAAQAEEMFPDLLKNSPSNIAKLEDEIGKCKGHQKYLAQTRSPSDGSDVRWYFCKVPLAENDVAASVPKSEMVGKGEYFRFGMRDSLAIEVSFLQREEELLSCWWKEYAECSEGPKEQPSSSKKVAQRQSSFSLERGRSVELNQVEEERVGVPVKGGLYEVDLVKRHSFPVYWDGENRRVLRGHWFARKGADWLPLREDVSEQLEVAYRSQVWHRRTFQPSGLFAARVELQGSTPGLHALFTGEDNTWEAWLNIHASGFSSVISLGGNGMKLRRGYSASHSSKFTQLQQLVQGKAKSPKLALTHDARIEPLVCKEYIGKRPVIIPYHKGGKRMHIGFQEFTEDLAARSQAIMDRLNFVKVKVLTVCQSRSSDNLEAEESETTQEKEVRSYGSLMMERVTGSKEGRIDHVLQDKTFQHPYLAAIGAHTNYWRDYDTALLILKHLYRGVHRGVHDESLHEESSRRNSKTESGFTGWSDQRETAEEERPLTFSDSTVINFSTKANKFPYNSWVITQLPYLWLQEDDARLGGSSRD
ncbi:hypothetical protein C1H46_033955 [Malus baccata]|uniref:DDHD domain-containing protein n=1 Tax=Malus baccata TaxID=106549 RepID=A0A540L2J8_MALBA|nr:hypothetical protein C1H46_033955 [Malus baccata]